MIRAVIAPIFLFLILYPDAIAVRIGVVLYFIGAVTDYIDGWMARKYKMVSQWGIFFDPLADKFLTTAAFLAFVILGIIPLWMVLIIIIRDFGTTFLRIYADTVGTQIKTSYSAKVKTFFQMTFIAYLLILIFWKNTYVISYRDFNIHHLTYSTITYIIMLLLTIFTLWTAVEYIIQNKNLIISLISSKKMKKKFVNEKTFQ